ncbi:unnamed protein product [Spirodela intermedia]|uniref:Ubiquitin receptor RAD23 n=1 Tax=Spirodela intermedia TaxID=51605 RepID=A0A7I8ILG1_SPIIN|nr:unnamed protein product [Spirodela intermedia]CAA6658652.1 unnamed protein product [Spirodela intermedia]
MKLSVKTLKGFQFEIEVKPEDTVCDVKKNIESFRGQNVYPAEKQMLIYQGKILVDDTTLEQNGVMDSSFLVVMLNKLAMINGVVRAVVVVVVVMVHYFPCSARDNDAPPPPPPPVLRPNSGGLPATAVVTPEEQEAINRLEAMGFDRAQVTRVFFVCSKNEELAANYLLDHSHEFN